MADTDPSTTYDLTVGRRILLHPGDDAQGQPALYMEQSRAVLDAPVGRSSVAVLRSDGICLAGPLSVMSAPDAWRVFGLWKVNPMTTACIPSTTYTPNAWLRPDIPVPSPKVTAVYLSVASLMLALETA